jgi:multidrug resistance efflux pump
MEFTQMIRSQLLAVAIISALSVSSRADQDSSQISNPVVAGLVKVADEIKLPAKEPGVLVHLAAHEGVTVRTGEVIGKIDDSEPQMQRKAAQAAFDAAVEKYRDNVEIRFAYKTAEYEKAKFDWINDANKQTEKAVAEVEVREAKLGWDKAELGKEKSIHDQKLAKFDAFTKQAELEAAELAIQRRVVKAPFDGVVEEIKRHQDEWVQPGDTILTLLRMDVLHVEAAVEQSKYDPHEIQGCEVTVDVEMARGRKATFKGRIIKVSSIVRSDGVYNVRAEIANQQDHGNWLLRDGLPAQMTIHLGTGGTTPAVSRAR